MSREELTVLVGHEGPGTIEAATDAFESRGSFGVLLENHAGPAHVHCRLDGDLSRIATLTEPNYYVDAEGDTFVPVIVDEPENDIEGRLELSIGYGATSTTVDVTVLPERAEVSVDESLSRPSRTEHEPTPIERASGWLTTAGLEPASLGVVVLGALALGLGLATAAVIGNTAAVVGIFVVAVGVTVAFLALLW